MGGKAAELEDIFVATAFVLNPDFSPSLSSALTLEVLEVEELEAPKVNPTELVVFFPGFDVDVGLFPKVNPPEALEVALPKEKPPLEGFVSDALTFSVVFNGSLPLATPAKEKPPFPIELPVVAVPKENPPAPMDTVVVWDGEFVALFLSSYPGRTVSQAGQTVLSPGLRQEHISHFQLSLSTWKVLPHPSAVDGVSRSSSWWPSPSASDEDDSSSSESSPSPNSHSMYQAMKSTR